MAGNPYDQFVAVPNPYDKFTPTKPTAKPSPKGPGFWETIARAAENVPQALSDTAANAGAFGQDLLQTVRNLSPEGQRGSAPALPQSGSTQALIAALKSAPAATMAMAKGGVQQVRNLSSAAQQGTAPAMDTTAIQAAQEDLYKRRGIDLGPQGRPFNPQNLSADVIAHPLGAIVDVGGAALGGGPLALRGGKAALEVVDLAAALAAAKKAQIAAPFKAGGRAIAAPVSRFLDAGSAAAKQEALVAGEVPRQQTLDLLRKQKKISGIESYRAGEKTRQNLTKAEARKTQFAEVLSQQVAAKTEAEAIRASAEAAIAEAGKTKPFAPGASVTAGEQGGILRTDVAANRAKTLKPFEDIDAKLRPQVEADRAAREAAGESVADIKEGKDLLKASKNSMSPSPATRPTVSSIPRSDTGGRMHEMIIDALENNTVKLSKAEADIAKAAGYDVKEIPTALESGIPGETIYLRTFKTSAEALDNLGRYFGEQAFGKGEAFGFPAVSKKLIGDKYFEIQNALNKFTPSRIPLQANYEAKLAADAPFKGTAVGKGSLETVKKTDIPKFTEEDLANKAFTSRQGYANAKALAGPETAKTLLVERLKNEFRDSATGGQKSFDAVQKILDANQGRIRGIIKDEPEVEKLVNNHLQQLKDAELNAIDAQAMIGLKATKFDTLSENLGVQSKTIKEQITSAKKEAEKSIKAKENALTLQRIFGTEISALKSADENKIIGDVERLTESMRKKGDIDIATHEKIIASTKEYKIALNKADTADKRAKLRQAYVKKIPYLLGAGAATSAGFGAFNIFKGE